MPWHHDGDNGVLICKQKDKTMANFFLSDGEIYLCKECWRRCSFEVKDGKVKHEFTAEKEGADNEG